MAFVGHITMDMRIMDGVGSGIWFWTSTYRNTSEYSGSTVIFYARVFPVHRDDRYRGFSLTCL